MAGTRPRSLRLGWRPFMLGPVTAGASACLPSAADERGNGPGRLQMGSLPAGGRTTPLSRATDKACSGSCSAVDLPCCGSAAFPHDALCAWSGIERRAVLCCSGVWTSRRPQKKGRRSGRPKLARHEQPREDFSAEIQCPWSRLQLNQITATTRPQRHTRWMISSKIIHSMMRRITARSLRSPRRAWADPAGSRAGDRTRPRHARPGSGRTNAR